MPLVHALHVPNAPYLIAPEAFGGTGRDTAEAIRALDVLARWRPDALVVVSPHWVSRDRFLVSDSPRPKQIYDFGGLPPVLYAVQYEPPGAPELAHELVSEGVLRGLPVGATHEWGLDHGAWAPLLHVVPGAAVPVLPLSIRPGEPALHLSWGEAIGSVLRRRTDRLVLVSTGSITHSFRRMRPDPGARWSEGAEIEREIVDLIVARKYRDLTRFDARKWEKVEPEGELNPLFVLLGAVGESYRPRVVSTGQVHGAFGMTVIEFTPPSEGT